MREPAAPAVITQLLDVRDYLGSAQGAQKISFPHRILRRFRLRQPERISSNAKSPSLRGESKEVGRGGLPFEFIVNALRLERGVASFLFSRADRHANLAASMQGSAKPWRAASRDRRPTPRPTDLGRRF